MEIALICLLVADTQSSYFSQYLPYVISVLKLCILNQYNQKI